MSANITGSRILIKSDFLGFELTQTVVTTWIVMIVLVLICRFLTSHLTVHPTKKRQIIAEWIVTAVQNLVRTAMGEQYLNTWYVPFIGAMFALSAGCSLSSVFGAKAPTCDLSTVLGWAMFVFVLITVTKFRTNGLLGYLKGFCEPVFVMAPMNVISEVATPVSMALRHFGNIASGSIITTLIYGGLSALTSMILGLLPGALGNTLSQIPILQVGIPAVLSLYFDFFSSILQAYIFCTLTMIYVSGAAATPE
ncbi:MAG: F0F1 ATP synthase subunit A [Clostridiales bacterium]|nr:F0F1 ATP synthase subunit A [Clostridiales bacterium]